MDVRGWTKTVADEVFADICADVCRHLRRRRSGRKMEGCVHLVIPEEMNFLYYDTRENTFRLSECGAEIIRETLRRCQRAGITMTACMACCDLGRGFSLDIPAESGPPAILHKWCRRWWKERAQVCIGWKMDDVCKFEFHEE